MPTLVFTDSYGRELFRYSGFIGAQALSALLRSLPHDVSEFNRLSKVLDRNRNTLSALNAMGSQLRAAGLYLASNQVPTSEPCSTATRNQTPQRGRPC